MGGLIVLYAAIAHQDVFGKAAIFRPSLWFSNQVYNFVLTNSKQQTMKIYLVAGDDESSAMLPDLHKQCIAYWRAISPLLLFEPQGA